ncbi:MULTISPECIES: ABC transporter substrate-binding protein [unclassified Bradyrhizobium]|uniref:ABC transporter substrate-binding protein n=1 Tax=unclassified Bradyrhizobium TaxID=2631580 RepID=UPI00024D1CB9|nr:MULTISPECIES: extracellular solute-binding protein [Bradyrhizobium]EHR01009.1 spermidine/putrescine-binding periplasmic protein [Bradyrhizobium sp. WSM471]UFW43067.1 extracellular solute-binding protein [Bradyrhizobium canariense]
MKRRAFLRFATTAAAGVLAAPYVQAQTKKFANVTLRVNGFGGAFDEALRKGVAGPLEEKYGLKVQFTAGATQADLVKLIANKSSPPYDLFMCDSSYVVELLKADIVEEIKVSDVPNIKRVLPGFREFGDYGVPFNVSSVVPVFNSKYIKRPLTSYSDIARSDLTGRVILPAPDQIASSLYLLGMAEENGGSISEMEPAMKILSAAKPNIVALAQTNVAELQMFQSEEGYAGIFWDGRAHELRTKGIPIVTVFPSQGVYSTISYINVVKGMKYPEAAYAFADQLLSDQGMLAIPEALRYGVTTDVKLPEDLRRDLLFNSPERNALRKQIDWQQLWANRSGWIERVNKTIRN